MNKDMLPALPEPEHRERVYSGHGNEDVYEWYTADQMRAYARAAVPWRDEQIKRLRAEVAKWQQGMRDMEADHKREVEALRAERDAFKAALHGELDGNLRLRDLGGARPDEGMTAYIKRLIAERDALRAEVESLRADAERYRFIRMNHLWLKANLPMIAAPEFDAAIDAAHAEAAIKGVA